MQYSLNRECILYKRKFILENLIDFIDKKSKIIILTVLILNSEQIRMASMEKNNIVSDQVTVKNEPICYSESTKKTMKVKQEPIELSEEVEVKVENFSATEEFTNKISIAFLNEEPIQATTSSNDNNTISTNQETTSKSQGNKQKSK